MDVGLLDWLMNRLRKGTDSRYGTYYIGIQLSTQTPTPLDVDLEVSINGSRSLVKPGSVITHDMDGRDFTVTVRPMVDNIYVPVNRYEGPRVDCRQWCIAYETMWSAYNYKCPYDCDKCGALRSTTIAGYEYSLRDVTQSFVGNQSYDIHTVIYVPVDYYYRVTVETVCV